MLAEELSVYDTVNISNRRHALIRNLAAPQKFLATAKNWLKEQQSRSATAVI